MSRGQKNGQNALKSTANTGQKTQIGHRKPFLTSRIIFRWVNLRASISLNVKYGHSIIKMAEDKDKYQKIGVTPLQAAVCLTNSA